MEDSDILLALEELRNRLNSHGGKLEDSMLERYAYFVSHSEFKKECSYARKCKDIFLKYDYEAIKQIFLTTLDQFRIIEGDKFGR